MNRISFLNRGYAFKGLLAVIMNQGKNDWLRKFDTLINSAYNLRRKIGAGPFELLIKTGSCKW